MLPYWQTQASQSTQEYWQRFGGNEDESLSLPVPYQTARDREDSATSMHVSRRAVTTLHGSFTLSTVSTDLHAPTLPIREEALSIYDSQKTLSQTEIETEIETEDSELVQQPFYAPNRQFEPIIPSDSETESDFELLLDRRPIFDNKRETSKEIVPVQIPVDMLPFPRLQPPERPLSLESQLLQENAPKAKETRRFAEVRRNSTPETQQEDVDIDTAKLGRRLLRGKYPALNLAGCANATERREKVAEAIRLFALSLLLQIAERSQTIHQGRFREDEAESETGLGIQSQKRPRASPPVVLLPRVAPIHLSLRNRKKLDGTGRKISFPRRTRALPGYGITDLTALLRLLELIIDGLQTGHTRTKRDLYYTDTVLFRKQSTVDGLVDDLAATLGCRRIDLNIVASSKGLFFGDCSITLVDGSVIDATSSQQLIPSSEVIASVDLRDTEYILVVEKEAVFHTLVGTLNDAMDGKKGILLCGKGYPDLSTRELLRQLAIQADEGVKITALVDFDVKILSFHDEKPHCVQPYGIDILWTYRFGSKSMSFDSDNLAAPRLRWLGIRCNHVLDKHDQMLPMSNRDRNKALAILNRPDIPLEWQHEIQTMLFLNLKAEIEIMGGNQNAKSTASYVAAALLPAGV